MIPPLELMTRERTLFIIPLPNGIVDLTGKNSTLSSAILVQSGRKCRRIGAIIAHCQHAPTYFTLRSPSLTGLISHGEVPFLPQYGQEIVSLGKLVVMLREGSFSLSENLNPLCPRVRLAPIVAQ